MVVRMVPARWGHATCVRVYRGSTCSQHVHYPVVYVLSDVLQCHWKSSTLAISRCHTIGLHWYRMLLSCMRGQGCMRRRPSFTFRPRLLPWLRLSWPSSHTILSCSWSLPRLKKVCLTPSLMAQLMYDKTGSAHSIATSKVCKRSLNFCRSQQACWLPV